MFKKKYKTNKAPTNGNPYFNETNSFEDERGNDIAAKVSWRNIAFLLVLLMFISVGGNIYQGTVYLILIITMSLSMLADLGS